MEMNKTVTLTWRRLSKESPPPFNEDLLVAGYEFHTTSGKFNVFSDHVKLNAITESGFIFSPKVESAVQFWCINPNPLPIELFKELKKGYGSKI